MSEVKDREIVLPGQLLGDGVRCETLNETCIREDTKTYSLVKGLARVDMNTVSVIPLCGSYLPKPGDMVIGVIDYDFGGVYAVDINAAYRCILKPRSGMDDRGGGRGGRRGGGMRRGPDRRQEETYKVGELISAKVASVDEVREAQLVSPWKLEPAYVMRVKPKRVPRIIGKQKSMIELIRQYTRSRIAVGQNGLIWIKDGDIPLAVEAIRKVEAEAHTSGLTDRMTEMLKSRSKTTSGSYDREKRFEVD